MKNKIIAYLISAIIILPFIAHAASGSIFNSDICNGIDCNFDSLAKLINRVINWFLVSSVSIASITFAVGGAKILLNPGNDKAITEGKEVLKKTIIGMFIILGAWLLVHTVVKAVVKSPDALRFLN